MFVLRSGVVNRRVLIVDDHAGFRRSAKRALVSDGWTVVGEAADGETALREIERCRPDVVLLDVGLPDVSGLEISRRLSDRHPGLAVVMISTQDRADFGELALRNGARGFVTKLELDGQTLASLLQSK